MKILITGGAGFIASHIADRLVELDYDVVIFDNLSSGKVENINPKCKFYKGDITNYEAMKLVFDIERPEVVIHHAAQIDVQTSLKNPAFDAQINIIGTINVLECCRETKVRKIIYPSSAAVYGNPKYLPVDENHPVEPISFYGISKHTPCHYIKAYSELYNIKYTIFRYANVYGPRQDNHGEGGVVSIFANRLLRKETCYIYGDGKQTRDFIYVKDVANANVLALDRGDNEIIDISSNKPVTINQLHKVMKEISKCSVAVEYKEARNGDILHSYLSNEKASGCLGWKDKHDIKSGLKETLNYYYNVLTEMEVAAETRV
ncbi:NAD-dependent epimerase/dehydratase family protein [Clostridium cellulovorans]|uniref:NAD-dependent epimerase/dehydratase n=1 Tax=Clostridium cellulovorans (strain ATCC 35296 / DSM 3052 / OCM 3 / 743B) TaxID=573061 RepID=D9ST51_CLOC7|nr:NAD-dependent epimerase/dehydratase family protein [Clostridium cellulovorans]ADL50667.1 NAD-dependent epimerase/dehydratase [Clostridium cellulovorans 743B]